MCRGSVARVGEVFVNCLQDRSSLIKTFGSKPPAI